MGWYDELWVIFGCGLTGTNCRVVGKYGVVGGKFGCWCEVIVLCWEYILIE